MGLAQPGTDPPADPVKLIFIHHSCGENWLADDHGGLGLALRDNNYFVSDTNYDWGTGSIGSRTDIGHWYDWFLGPMSATYLAELFAESEEHSWGRYSRMAVDPGGENEIIMFKSCYPNSNFTGNPSDPPLAYGTPNPLYGQDAWSEDMTVENAKGLYRDLLVDYFATRLDKLFIVVTAPPVCANDSNGHPENARGLNGWLVTEFLAGYPHDNVAVFDFYNTLTSNGGDPFTNDAGWVTGNHHRWWSGAEQHQQTEFYDLAAYPSSSGDSHPTPAGNQKATEEFVLLLNYFYNRWHSLGSCADNLLLWPQPSNILVLLQVCVDTPDGACTSQPSAISGQHSAE